MNMQVPTSAMNARSTLTYPVEAFRVANKPLYSRALKLYRRLTIGTEWNVYCSHKPRVLIDGTVANGSLMRRVSEGNVEYRQLTVSEQFESSWDQANQM